MYILYLAKNKNIKSFLNIKIVYIKNSWNLLSINFLFNFSININFLFFSQEFILNNDIIILLV